MYPHLQHLALAYFNQDWRFDANTSDGVLAQLVQESPPSDLSALQSEIDDLLAGPFSEDQFRQLWTETLLSSYDPSDDGYTYREWFAHVRDLLTVT